MGSHGRHGDMSDEIEVLEADVASSQTKSDRKKHKKEKVDKKRKRDKHDRKKSDHVTASEKQAPENTEKKRKKKIKASCEESNQAPVFEKPDEQKLSESNGDVSLDDLLRMNKSVDDSISLSVPEKQSGHCDSRDDASGFTPCPQDTQLSVFVANLSYHIDEDTIYDAFKNCGPNGTDSILALKWGMDENGEFKRYAHIDFDCTETVQNALKLNGTKVLGKPIRVEPAKGSNDSIVKSSKNETNEVVFNEAVVPKDNPDCIDRCCVKNLPYSITEDILLDAFERLGITASHISWVTDRETGRFYGTSFVTFSSPDEAALAVSYGETGEWTVGGRRGIKVEFCPHRRDRQRPSGVAAKGDKSGGSLVGRRTDFVRPPSARPANGTKTCFFGNLPYDIDENRIKEFCADVGEIKAIRWMEDAKTGEFKGAGFCDFENDSIVDRVVKLKNGRKLGGQTIRVDYAPNTKTKHTKREVKQAE